MATAKQSVRLRWRDPQTGSDHERQLTLPVRIGRGAENTIIIEHDLVSRQHALLNTNQQGQIVLLDIGSANGILMGGAKIDYIPLKDKDQFQIGKTIFTITLNSTRHVVCHNCAHKVDIRHYDCPYCGFSLVGAQKS